MRKFQLTKAKLFLGFGLMVGLLFLQDHKASASGTVEPVTVDTVNYKEEEIILNNNGNTKFYFATETDAARGSWEVIPADVNTDEITTMDFSWVSNSLENIIKVKGGDDPTGTQVRIVLPEKTTKLEISINYSNINSLAKTDSIAPLLNIMTTAGTSADPITYNDLEWKKGKDGYWKDIVINPLTVAQLEKYQIKGTELYFRIKADNDVTQKDGDGKILSYPEGSKGRRASSEVMVKINKKATAMVVGIDGSKFTADIKYGKEYRATVGTNRTKDWIKITEKTTRRLDLIDVIKELDDIPDGITKPFPAMFLEIRDYATTKAAASKITEISLNAQRVLDKARVKKGPAPRVTDTTDQSIYISYTGDKNMVLTIPSASSNNPFEYCVVKPGETLDLSNTLWSAITKGTDVKILKSKAVDNGILYIRQKEIKSRAATRTTAAISYELASTVITHDIQYPNTPIVEKGNFTFVKNITLDSNKIEFDITLNTVGRDPYELEIKSIKLGTKNIDFTPTYTPAKPVENGDNDDYSYIITVTLDQTSLQNTPNCYNRGLTITFTKGTVDKTSVLLTVKYPTEALALTAIPDKGSATGKTKVGIPTDPGEGNAYGYMITPESMEDKIFVEDFKANYTNIEPFTPLTDISVVDKTYLTIIEYNIVTGHFVKYKCIPITPEIIG